MKREKRSQGSFAWLGRGGIFFWLCKRFDRIRFLLTHGFWARIATAYTVAEQALENGFLCSKLRARNVPDRVTSETRRKIASLFEQSVLVKYFGRLGCSMLYKRARTYGSFLLSFGLGTLSLSVLRRYALRDVDAGGQNILFSACVILCSVPLLAGKGTILSFIAESGILRAILWKHLDIHTEAVSAQKSEQRGYGSAIMLGLFLGVFTMFIDPFYYGIGFVLFVAIFLIFRIPELGILLFIGAIPFLNYVPHPTFGLALMVLTVDISYFVKWIRGKRMFQLGLLDLLISFLVLLYAFGGVISAGGSASLAPAMLSVILLSAYFLVVNLFRSADWLLSAWKTFWIAGTVSAAAHLGQIATESVNASWVDMGLFSDMGVRITGGFGNPNVYAEFLLMLLPLSLAMLCGKKRARYQCVIGLCAAILAVSMVFTWSRGAWLGTLLALFLFALIVYKRSLLWLFFAALLSPAAIRLIPHNISSRFLSIGNFTDSSVSYRFSVWRGTWDMLIHSYGCGIGVGYPAFSAVYPIFAYGGSSAVRHAHSLYLEIAAELGIVGVIVFLSVIAVFSQMCLESLSKVKHSQGKYFTAAGFSSVFGLLLMGVTDHIWYDPRIFLSFWVLIALVAAQARIVFTEREFYLLDAAGNQYSADIDIQIHSYD